MSNLQSTVGQSEGPMINWQYLWLMAKRHYWLFLLVFIPIVAGTFVYLYVTKPLYESTAVVQVEEKAQSQIQTGDAQSGEDLMSDDAVKTIEQNMQSFDLFEAVVKDPDIANDPDFLVGYPSHEGTPTPSELAQWVSANSKIALQHGTRLIGVTVYHRVPEMAKKLAGAIVAAYGSLGGEANAETKKATLQLLSNSSTSIKQNLQNAEQALETYKDLLDLRKRIGDQQTVIDNLKERYREKHPQMIQARALLAEMNKEFDDAFQKSSSNPVNNGPGSTPLDMSGLSFDDRVSAEIKFVEARSQVLQKEVDTETALFDNILKQERDAAVSQDTYATEIRLVEPPMAATHPSKPKKSIILMLGFSMATFLGLGAVVAVRALDSTIDSPMEAEAALGLPVIGTILRATPRKDPASANPRAAHMPALLSEEMVVATDPGSATAEGFRSLRAVVNLLGKPADNRTILFTSALPGEGKTYVSCNYALSLSMTGVRTLLIDTDMRRPEVHNRLKLENKIGLSEMINQELELDQVVHAKVAKNFDVLTAGGPCPNPAELLAGEGFKLVLAKALASYDRVVVDTGPVNLVSDCLLVVPDINVVCFVLRAGSTARQAPLHAISLLRRAQKEPTGIILNAIAPGSDRLYLGYKGRGGVGSYGNVYS